MMRTTALGEDGEGLELLRIAGGNRKWCSAPKTAWRYLKSLNRRSSHGPSVVPLSICPREVKTYVYKLLIAIAQVVGYL